MTFSRLPISVLKCLIVQDTLQQSCSVVPRRFAGHSHWQNVRHEKAATDAHKSTTTSRHVRLIEGAVHSGGGPNPKLNIMLANAIEAAKRTQVVSNAAVEAAIKRASDPSAKKNTLSLLMELYGEHGVIAVANVETGNSAQFRHEVKGVCKKYTWAIAKGGVKERFEEKHYIIVNEKQDASPIDHDDILAVGIEAGAEDMNEIGEGPKKLFEFFCTSSSKYPLAKALRENGYSINDMGIKWEPIVGVEVTEEQAEKVGKFCDAMEDLPDVIGVYTNLK